LPLVCAIFRCSSEHSHELSVVTSHRKDLDEIQKVHLGKEGAIRNIYVDGESRAGWKVVDNSHGRKSAFESFDAGAENGALAGAREERLLDCRVALSGPLAE